MQRRWGYQDPSHNKAPDQQSQLRPSYIVHSKEIMKVRSPVANLVEDFLPIENAHSKSMIPQIMQAKKTTNHSQVSVSVAYFLIKINVCMNEISCLNIK